MRKLATVHVKSTAYGRQVGYSFLIPYCLLIRYLFHIPYSLFIIRYLIVRFDILFNLVVLLI